MKVIITAVAVFMAVHAVASNPFHAYSFAIATGRPGAYGHGCAVNGKLITNAHMVDPRDSYDYEAPSVVYFRYEFADGTSGIGKSAHISSVADLASITIDKNPPYGYARLGPEPKVGDRIFWVEYDFRKQKNVFKPRERDGKIIKIIAGHILLDEKVTRGASGGCAYNQAGGVVGLVTFGFTTHDGKTSTGIVGIWGDWFQNVVFDDK